MHLAVRVLGKSSQRKELNKRTSESTRLINEVDHNCEVLRLEWNNDVEKRRKAVISFLCRASL